jgi:hypothetical protein
MLDGRAGSAGTASINQLPESATDILPAPPGMIDLIALEAMGGGRGCDCWQFPPCQDA